MAVDLEKYRKATTTKATGSPKIDLSKYKKENIYGPVGNYTPFSPVEGFRDIKQTAQNIGSTLGRTGNRLKEAITAGARGEQSVLETGLQTAGSVVGGALGTVMDIGVGAGKLVLPEKAEKAIGAGVQRTVGAVAGTQPVQKAIEAYQNLSPRAQRNIAAGADIASLVPAGTVVRGAKAAAPVVARGTKAVVSPVVTAARSTIKRIPSRKTDVAKIVGEISQATDDFTKSQIQKGLSSIDTAGVTSYKQLYTRANDKVSELASLLDDALDTNQVKYTPEQVTIRNTIGGQEVEANFVDAALKQLDNLYTATNDPFEAARIKALQAKFQTEGLTVKEINDLARNYGNEFKKKAFTKTGEPLTGVTAQGVENTRQGIKQTARDLFGDDVFARADEELTNVIKLRDSAKAMEKQVQKLKNKIKERSLGEKTGRLLFQVIDAASLGTFGGFTRSILPRGQGLKVMNALDLEKTLQKNLNDIERVLNLPNKSQVEVELRKLLNSYSQALPESQLNTSNAANTAKNVVIPTQSTKAVEKSSGLINRILGTDIPNKQGGFIRIGKETPNSTLPKQKVNESVSLPKNTTKDLVEEAKKYKSAEEFVKAELNKRSFTTNKPITVYRGVGSGIGNTTLVHGKYFAGDEEFAKVFGNVTKSEIPAGTKIFDLDTIKNGNTVIDDTTLVDTTKLTDFLIDNGYKYTKNTNTRGVEYVELKPTLESLNQTVPVETFTRFDSIYRDLAEKYNTFNAFYKQAEKRADDLFETTGKYQATNVNMLREYFNQVKTGNIPKSTLSSENKLEQIWKEANKK